jgi:3-oxoacyl-[acyl-carrier protein] reductase
VQNLKGKSAVVFGAGGSIGGAVAKELAANGAEVFLSGRSVGAVQAVADAIGAAGGTAHVAKVDAEDETAVGGYLDGVAKQAGRLDIVFNAMGPPSADYGNNKPAVDTSVAEFMVPLTTIVKSQFITSRAAARLMIPQRAGVIIFLTGSPARAHVQGATAIGAAFGAIENFMANLALELGEAGVRSVCLRTTANTDTRTIQAIMEHIAQHSGQSKADITAMFGGYNFLKVPAVMKDTAKAVAFLASDDARLMTATVMNSSAGAALD